MERRTRTNRRIAAVAMACLVAGCAGGASVPNAPTGGAANTAAARTGHRREGSARFEIRIPRHRRHAHYVSPNTKSMTISIDGKKYGTYNLTPAATGCSTIDAATQCSFTIGIPTGTHTFAVSLFASTDGSGTALSGGSIVKTIAAGVLAVIPLTLSGVVASIEVELGNASPKAGTAATIPVYVSAFDASGARIIGPGNYAGASGAPLSVTLSDTDTSGITSLSTKTVNGPGAKVTLTYSGKSIWHATIGASATGVSIVTPATFAPQPTIFASYTVPAAIAGGTAAIAITSGPDGNLWYTTKACSGCSGGPGFSGIVKLTPSGTQAAYVGGVVANLAANGDFEGIAPGADGNVWFTDGTNKTVGVITPAGTVTTYSTGTDCPERIVAAPAPDTGLWYTSNCTAAVGHVSLNGTVVSYPLSGGGSENFGILVGKDKNLYIADKTNSAIGQVVLSGTAVGSYSELPIPANPLGGANMSLQGLAQTSDGQIWFTNAACTPSTLGSITLAGTFTASTIHQFTTKQGCADPAYMTVTPNGGTIFEALWDYPVIESAVPTTIGGAPTLTDYALQAQSPNTVFQQTWDITIGPDGNVWSTVNTNDSSSPGSGANVVELAY
jgi:streptogramin lyase